MSRRMLAGVSAQTVAEGTIIYRVHILLLYGMIAEEPPTGAGASFSRVVPGRGYIHEDVPGRDLVCVMPQHKSHSDMIEGFEVDGITRHAHVYSRRYAVV